MAGTDVPGEDREATRRTDALRERLQATEAELAAVKAELKAVTSTRVWRRCG